MKPRSDQLRAAYRDPAVAKAYDAERSRNTGQRARAFLERAMIRRALRDVGRVDRILDVACGTGRLAATIGEGGVRLTGVDVSAAMLAVARERGVPAATWVGGDAMRLPFADASFDLVVSHRFLRHLHAKDRALVFRELARVSRRWVIVELLTGASLVSWVRGLRHGRSWAREMSLRRPDPAAAVAELAACGLRVVSCRAIIAWISEPHLYVCERT